MLEFGTVLLVQREPLAQNTKIQVLCVRSSEIFVVASDQDIASVDNVVEELTGFVCSEQFLLSNWVLELGVIEFA
jgi:hypothetical protein